MLLFARTATIAPAKLADAAEWSVEIAAKVSTITGLDVKTWASVYGAPLNTVSWTCRVENHAEMGVAGEKLLADPSYLDATAAAAELFEGAPEDALVEMVAFAGDGGHDGQYASLITAQCAGGRIAEAMAWGVDMMQHVASLTGRDAIFTRSLYGPWATVGWISLADSLDQVDAGTAATATDPTYLERVDQSGDLFTPGSGHARLSRRIG